MQQRSQEEVPPAPMKRSAAAMSEAMLADLAMEGGAREDMARRLDGGPMRIGLANHDVHE